MYGQSPVVITLTEHSDSVLTNEVFDLANKTMVNTVSSEIDSRATIGQVCVLPPYVVR